MIFLISFHLVSSPKEGMFSRCFSATIRLHRLLLDIGLFKDRDDQNIDEKGLCARASEERGEVYLGF